MLEPEDRSALLDLVRPPEGYALDRAIGTTYSLDLLAMLFVPLAFSMFEWERDDNDLEAGCIPLLEALRRHADHYHIFCQSGRIAVPTQQSPLFAYLEKCVVEVRAPRGGVFHPKVWALRYAGDEGVIYRLLCLSRNLTFDRCWDTALVLQGRLTSRARGFSLNRPLGDFFQALPGIAIHAVSQAAQEDVGEVAEELKRVEFEEIPDVPLVRFWPLGIGGHTKDPFEGDARRLLVVSPFVDSDMLDAFADWSERASFLVSRPEQLDLIPSETLQRFTQVYCLDTPDTTEDAKTEPADALSPLQGLHAKLYVADRGHRTRVWTGSANATAAAYQRNVEFLVELEGRRARCGVDALLKTEGPQAALGFLLRRYERAEVPVPAPDLQEEAEWDRIRSDLAANLGVTVGEYPGPGTYTMEMACKATALALPAGVEVACWPITMSEAHALHWEPGGAVGGQFREVSFEALTSFFAFEARRPGKPDTSKVRFVLNLPVTGMPGEREQRLLKSILRDPDRVLRFMLLLLAEQRPDLPEIAAIMRRWELRGSATPVRWEELPLFEALVKALHHDPASLDHVKRLIDDLTQGEGPDLLPSGFLRIWEPIWQAREGLRTS